MGITSGELARRLVNEMIGAGTEFAVLHRRQDLLDGLVESDIDLVSAEPASEVIARLARALAEIGLKPVLVWPYDAGLTATVFLSRDDASEGLQLDLLCDPSGRGKYGVRSRALLDSAIVIDGWPALPLQVERLYLLRKRLVKRQCDEVERIVDGFSPRPPGELIDRLFTARAAKSIKNALAGRAAEPSRRPPLVFEAVRVWHRLRRPIGSWIHLGTEGEVAALELARRFRRFVPVALAQESSSGWHFRLRVLKTRLRPGLIFSWGPRPEWPTPDLLIEVSRLEDVAHQVVDQLRSSVLRRLGLD